MNPGYFKCVSGINLSPANRSLFTTGFILCFQNKVFIPLNKIPQFSKELFSFILSFISLFVRVIPELLINEIHFLIFLPIILIPASTIIPFLVFY